MSSSQISYKRYKEALEFHFAPILKFFSDKQITDIESNDDGNIYAHHIDGSSELLPVHLQPESIAAVAALLAAKGQNDITDDNPSVSAVWPDPPYRIEIVLPKAVRRPCMVIRRFAQIVYPLEHFIENGTLTAEMAKTIKNLIIRKKNIVISGETGSGKTTLMNTLLKEIPTEDRLFIIEDTRELQCSAPNKVSVLTGDNYTARKAIKNALRFRPEEAGKWKAFDFVGSSISAAAIPDRRPRPFYPCWTRRPMPSKPSRLRSTEANRAAPRRSE